MSENAEEQALNEAVKKLETALLSPVVSGELVSWVQTAQQAAKGLAEPLQRFIKTVLRAEYAEISESDQELQGRVQQMADEDKSILQEHEAFQKDLADLARRAPQVASDEAKLEDSRLGAEKRGVDIILRIKRQQAAIGTWLSEAVLRDRGTVD